jgi:hypothetical protein
MAMPKAIFVFIILTSQPAAWAQGTDTTHSQPPKKQNSKITTSTFEGIWKGEETCSNIGAPVATITITGKSATEVIITGMYSTTGEVIGIIKNNTINIPRQQIPDPIFMQMRIEGNLTLSKDRHSLSGILLISNHDARDNCGVIYVKK